MDNKLYDPIKIEFFLKGCTKKQINAIGVLYLGNGIRETDFKKLIGKNGNEFLASAYKNGIIAFYEGFVHIDGAMALYLNDIGNEFAKKVKTGKPINILSSL